MCLHVCLLSFFFNDTATTEIYTLSLHDALPILLPDPEKLLWYTQTCFASNCFREPHCWSGFPFGRLFQYPWEHIKDRKSTRLNSSHANISYAVFCLKKKNKNTLTHTLISVSYNI